jgi:hypothetical protein
MKFVCFSSGSQPRYRDDIIRAMAMPDGAELTFRYRLKYLGNSVQESVKSSRFKAGDDVLITYVDQSDKTKATVFIPVRYASLIEVPEIGDFVVLRMRVGKLAYAKDLDVFNQDLRSQSAEVPEWKPTDTEYPTGRHWVEVENYPKSVIASTSVSDWQGIVTQLSKRIDFSTTGPFYRLSGVRRLPSGQPVTMADDSLSLAGGCDHELLIDHYIPRPDPGKFQLEVQVSGRSVEFLSGAKLQLDSPYDRHWVRFRTLESLRDESVVFIILKKLPTHDASLEFNLPSIVKGKRRKAILIGTLVGVLLAAPQIAVLLSNPAFETVSALRIVMLAGFTLTSNIAAGVMASFNFRKPIGSGT